MVDEPRVRVVTPSIVVFSSLKTFFQTLIVTQNLNSSWEKIEERESVCVCVEGLGQERQQMAHGQWPMGQVGRYQRQPYLVI